MTSVLQIDNQEVELTILRAQVESNGQGLYRCGRRATSKLSYAEEMDQRQDASSPSPLSSPPTDGSYQTPVTESVTVMDMVMFGTIFFELLVFFTFTLLTLHFAY